MLELFNRASLQCSKIITEHYSTSFTLGIRTLDRKFPLAHLRYLWLLYATLTKSLTLFHDFDKKSLLARFRADTYQAIEEKISLNPILHSFQLIVNEYGIEHDLIEAFLHSMEMDLYEHEYTADGYQEYIYGSAEVVGLMCFARILRGRHYAARPPP